MIETVKYLENFRTTHYWCSTKNDHDIEVADEKTMAKFGFYMHAHVWGDNVWDQSIRGYYDEKTGTISCHSFEPVPKRTVRKIMKAFESQGLICLKFKGEIK